MHQPYMPFDFDDSYFESAPTPSSFGTPVASSSQLAVSHSESFERYANPSASTSAAGPSTSQQTIPRQRYTLPTPDEYLPAEGFRDAEPLGLNEVVPAMPQPNTLQYQLTTIEPAATPFHSDPAYIPYQPVPVPAPTTPVYQLTAFDPAPMPFLPQPVQYELFAVVPATTAFLPDAAYNPRHSPAVSSAEETPAQTAKGPETASGGSQSSTPAKGLRWKRPIVPAHPPPPQVAHVTPQGKPQPSSSKGRGKRKEWSHDVPASEEEHGFETGMPIMTPSQPGETMMVDLEFRNILGRPAKKQKRIPVDQSVPIPGRYCRGCGTNFSRPDGLKRHQRREKCGIENVPVAAIVTADTRVVVQAGFDGENGNATSEVENTSVVFSAAATAKKNAGRRGRGNPRKRKAGEQDGHLSGPMANPDFTPLFAPEPVSSTEIAATKVWPWVAAIGKKGQVVEQRSDSTPTDNQAAYEFAPPVGTAMPYYGQCGGPAYSTHMASSHPSYGPPVGSDRQQYYCSTPDQNAHAGTYLGYAAPGLGGPGALTAMAAPQEVRSFAGERRTDSYHQGQPSQDIPGADPSGHAQGVYYMRPTDVYPESSASQNSVSDTRYPLMYYGHAPEPYPQQTGLDVPPSQTSFPLQQLDQYSTAGDHRHDFGSGELVGRSFHSAGREVLADASHHQTHVEEYQSSDRLHDFTNTYQQDRLAGESDTALGQPAPLGRQQPREVRAVSRLSSDNTFNVESENARPVNRRPFAPKLKGSTPLQNQLSTSSVLVSSTADQGHSQMTLAGTVPISIITVANACKRFSSPEKPTPTEETNDADSDDDSLFTDRGSSPP